MLGRYELCAAAWPGHVEGLWNGHLRTTASLLYEKRVYLCGPQAPGDWESGRHVFTYDWEDGIATSLEIGNAQTYYIQNGVCYGQAGSSEFRLYEFRPVSADTMEIYSFLEEKSYTLKR